MKHKLVIVIPIYEDNESAKRLLSEIRDIFKKEVFIVAIDDGSLTNPFCIKFLNSMKLNGVILKLKKNVGHQTAIAIGLQYVADQINWADKIVVMDSDGEDNPQNVSVLLNSCNDKSIDVVVGSRRARYESLQFKFFYNFYRFIFKILTGKSIGFGNFMCMNVTALKRIVTMPESWMHIAACILLSKLRIKDCGLDRGRRYAGQSKSNFVGFALHGFKALMVFSEYVLVRVGVACAFIAVFSVVGGIIAVLLKFIGIATPGWFSVVVGILFLVFLQTGALTLMSLLLTGVSGTKFLEETSYKKYVHQIKRAKF